MSLRTLQDYEDKARQILPPYALGWIETGTEDEKTIKRNREIWKRLLVIPKALVDVSNRNQMTSLLGGRIVLSSPIAVAPTGFNQFAHPDGEIAVAQACADLNMLYAMSYCSSHTWEKICEATPRSIKWADIHLFTSRQTTTNMITRAENIGCSALVVTVDVQVLSRRAKGPDLEGQDKYGYQHLVQSGDKWAANFTAGDKSHIASDPSTTWDDIKWLTTVTKLPIVVKGLMSVHDARLAVKHGATGIVVSNHGGRQLDSAPSAIEMLPKIVEAVGDKCEIYVDGGVRYGTDVFKCLAYGAKAVFIGRPVIYGIAVDGKNGARNVLSILRDELDIAMALTGCRSINEISADSIVCESQLLPAKL